MEPPPASHCPPSNSPLLPPPPLHPSLCLPRTRRLASHNGTPFITPRTITGDISLSENVQANSSLPLLFLPCRSQFFSIFSSFFSLGPPFISAVYLLISFNRSHSSLCPSPCTSYVFPCGGGGGATRLCILPIELDCRVDCYPSPSSISIDYTQERERIIPHL